MRDKLLMRPVRPVRDQRKLSHAVLPMRSVGQALSMLNAN